MISIETENQQLKYLCVYGDDLKNLIKDMKDILRSDINLWVDLEDSTRTVFEIILNSRDDFKVEVNLGKGSTSDLVGDDEC